MVRNPFAVEKPPLQDILDSLDDPDCRSIIEQLDEPMTASELSEACKIPLSTTYRKLKLLTDASLLDEQSFLGITEAEHTGGGRDKGSFLKHTLLTDPEIVLRGIEDANAKSA